MRVAVGVVVGVAVIVVEQFGGEHEWLRAALAVVVTMAAVRMAL